MNAHASPLPAGRPRDVAGFLDAVKRTPASAAAGRARLIFALDATASRQPSWDAACHVQGQMFLEADRLGGLEVQLVYYRGFRECRASRWVSRPADLVRLMTGVSCHAGHTQLRRVLDHVAKEAAARPVNALVFVGDCFEENLDAVGDVAGRLGLLGVKAFMFHEGGDPAGGRAFREVARLTGGAYCPLDAASPKRLRDLLAAVAAYAAGGREALRALAGRGNAAVALIEGQLPGR